MADFLDQDEIDRLQYELSVISRKKDLSVTAKEKVKAMYLEPVKSICPNELSSLNEIGLCINNINMKITSQSKYYDSFIKLKISYSRRV